jgi:hypothetical protein
VQVRRAAKHTNFLVAGFGEERVAIDSRRSSVDRASARCVTVQVLKGPRPRPFRTWLQVGLTRWRGKKWV